MADAQPGAAPRQRVCASADVPERGRGWGWDVLEYGHPARAFVLRHGGVLRAYVNRCAHVPVELDWQPGEFLDEAREFIICSVHGATYDPASGRCAGGPCGRGRLQPVVVAEEAGQVYWYPSRDLQPAFAGDPHDPGPHEPQDPQDPQDPP
jgi:nitrite reductase/ring-hydroxylating ferredoxin subunit